MIQQATHGELSEFNNPAGKLRMDLRDLPSFRYSWLGMCVRIQKWPVARLIVFNRI